MLNVFRVYEKVINSQANIYLPKVNNEIHLIDVVLVFLLLTLNISHFTFLSSVSITVFEQVNVSWVMLLLFSA